jgi:biopolymer transport protein TolR
MGMQSPNSSQTNAALAEINVTPLVDVMLVLLIVFMVSAPLMQQGVQVNLPKANAGSLDEVPEQVTLTVKKDRRIFLDNKAVGKGKLLKVMREKAKARPNLQVVVQADQSVNYGFVTQVIAEVKRANISKVGLVTAPEGKSKRL